MRPYTLLFPALMMAAPSSADAADIEVDLELVLAVDVSRSMDWEEQRLQRDGYVAAFRHPEVMQAIGEGAIGRIAVTYFEWAGPGFRTLITPWTVIETAADAEAFAATLEAAPITRETGTSISSGLFYASGRFEDNGFAGMRQAIDVSGDGPNNAGYPVDVARDAAIERGITINGLPIMLKSNANSPFNINELDIYYEDCVIGGPGAFMVTVTDINEIARAIRRKLVLEIAGLPPRIMFAAEQVQAAPRIDCQIGEKLRLRWMPQFDR